VPCAEADEENAPSFGTPPDQPPLKRKLTLTGQWDAAGAFIGSTPTARLVPTPQCVAPVEPPRQLQSFGGSFGMGSPKIDCVEKTVWGTPLGTRKKETLWDSAGPLEPLFQAKSLMYKDFSTVLGSLETAWE